jgi:hypothetical protein
VPHARHQVGQRRARLRDRGSSDGHRTVGRGVPRIADDEAFKTWRTKCPTTEDLDMAHCMWFDPYPDALDPCHRNRRQLSWPSTRQPTQFTADRGSAEGCWRTGSNTGLALNAADG